MQTINEIMREDEMHRRAKKSPEKTAYKKGVNEALNIAVDIFGIDPEIKRKVLQMIFKNNNITTIKR